MKRIEALNKKIKSEAKERVINFKNNEFRVRQYVSYPEKLALASIVVTAGEIEGTFSLVTSDTVFKLETLKVYTGIDYTGANIVDLYDIAMESGLYNEVVRAIPPQEFAELRTIVQKSIEDKQMEINKRESMASLINKITEVGTDLQQSLSLLHEDGKLEEVVGELQKQLETLDPSKLKYINAFMSEVNK